MVSVYEMQAGLPLAAAERVIVKLVPAVLAETVGCAIVVVQVTPSLAPKLESKVSRIWLFAVTRVVATTTVVAAAATDTLPAAAAAHVPAAEAQLLPV